MKKDEDSDKRMGRCPICGQELEGIYIDFGLGFNEFGSHSSIDESWILCCPICEVPLETS
jgi:hypothetical protein